MEKDQPKISQQRKRKWYEKFRWFMSSEGFLVIGGRDATTNEIVIKKHAEKDDIVFHTDISGGPFFVVKTEGRKPGKQTLQEAADATACYSRAWKLGHAFAEVFYVKPEQVSKKARAGEYLVKGAFMIYGRTTYVTPEMKVAVGIKNSQIIGGPVEAVKAQSPRYMEIVQGNENPSSLAKKIKSRLGGELDEIIRFLPPGPGKLSGP